MRERSDFHLARHRRQRSDRSEKLQRSLELSYRGVFEGDVQCQGCICGEGLAGQVSRPEVKWVNYSGLREHLGGLNRPTQPPEDHNRDVASLQLFAVLNHHRTYVLKCFFVLTSGRINARHGQMCGSPPCVVPRRLAVRVIRAVTASGTPKDLTKPVVRLAVVRIGVQRRLTLQGPL